MVICTVVQLVEKMGKKRETIQALRCLVCIKPVRYYPGANLSLPDKLQRTPLKPSMQPYVQFPSRGSHIVPTHVSQRCSQLTPYAPEVHSENNIQHLTGHKLYIDDCFGLWCLAQMIKFTSCLPMVGSSFRVRRLSHH